MFEAKTAEIGIVGAEKENIEKCVATFVHHQCSADVTVVLSRLTLELSKRNAVNETSNLASARD